jgi:hypothetical protein
VVSLMYPCSRCIPAAQLTKTPPRNPDPFWAGVYVASSNNKEDIWVVKVEVP